MNGRFIRRGLALLKAVVNEPWLAVHRVLTIYALKLRLRDRACRLQYFPEPGSVLYVAASSLPYHTSGYTTRTHELIRALGAAGAKVHVLTRPGYPWDRKDRQLDAMGVETLVDDVRYQHEIAPSFTNRFLLHYALQAARVVAKVAIHKRVAVIHAASNHVNALPALLAARHLGIPFQYEVRGLWELTRISRMPEYKDSQAYQQGLELEGLVARHADRLLVISEQLGNYARESWKVPAKRIALLPNCVDPGRIIMADPQTVEENTIGYAGALIGYEGLDTLIDAVDVLVRTGTPIAVTILGDGEASMSLQAQVKRLGLSDRIRFFGKVPPSVAREMLGRCAVVCIPRKPFKVCEIVPPIKLVEALAMGKTVVVPNLPVFRDELGAVPAALFFRSGDSHDLARVLKEAFSKPLEMRDLGLLARAYVEQHRTWAKHVGNVLNEIDQLIIERQGVLEC